MPYNKNRIVLDRRFFVTAHVVPEAVLMAPLETHSPKR